MLKVIQAVIFSIHTYEKYTVAVGTENKNNRNKYICNYRHRTPMLPLLGANHRLTLFHMAKRFIWIEETGEHINEYEIGCMINPSLHVNKSFK